MAEPNDDRDVIVKCRDVWKVFGTGFEPGLSETEVEALLVRRGLTAAVRKVTLDVGRGEVFCIMGLSGSGKSTLVRCMTGLVPLTCGSLSVLGVNIAEASQSELIGLRRHKMSMVFQDFALLPHLTVLENVAFPLRVRGMRRPEREAKAAEMVAQVGLEAREGYYPHELSGGQQQRVGIARSLASDPQLWFLDEPFSALDPLIRQDLQGELLRLQALLRKTVVFITHDFDEAIRLSSRIAIMKDGLVVQIGTPEQLVLAPATDYVARFTAKVALADVMRVRSVMSAPSDAPGEPISASALLREVAGRVLDAGRAVPVADGAGRIVGCLEPALVANILLGRRPSVRTS